MIEEKTILHPALMNMDNGSETRAVNFTSVRRPLNPDVHQILETLQRLQQARSCSIERNCDLWEFAIEITDFLHSGISKQNLRHMVALGWVSHKREITLPNLEQREFQNEAIFSFCDKSCFVITLKGRQQIRKISESHISIGDDSLQLNDGTPGLEKPVWDNNLLELRVGNVVVKKFKWPAAVQFAVLEKFEELGWPNRIVNPLPEKPNCCPKRRLHDAIKCLNQRMENDLIRFRGDGTGNGVLVQINVEKESEIRDVA